MSTLFQLFKLPFLFKLLIAVSFLEFYFVDKSDANDIYLLGGLFTKLLNLSFA